MEWEIKCVERHGVGEVGAAAVVDGSAPSRPAAALTAAALVLLSNAVLLLLFCHAGRCADW